MKTTRWLLLVITALLLVACTGLRGGRFVGLCFSPPRSPVFNAFFFPATGWSHACPGTAQESALSQDLASPQVVPSSTPSPSPQQATPTPAPTPIPLCPQVSSETGWQCQENRYTRTCEPDDLSAPAWACYEDLTYGFALEYPLGLNVEISIDTRSRSNVTLARRHSFWGILIGTGCGYLAPP